MRPENKDTLRDLEIWAIGRQLLKSYDVSQ